MEGQPLLTRVCHIGGNQEKNGRILPPTGQESANIVPLSLSSVGKGWVYMSAGINNKEETLPQE